MPKHYRLFSRENVPLLVLASFTILVFLMGGASRSDVASLIILRPLATLTAVLACFGVYRQRGLNLGFVLWFLLAMLLSIAVQLLPLPPWIWTSFPGRGAVKDLDRLMGEDALWRPIALVPSGAWNALWSMSVPIATTALAMLTPREQRFRMIVVYLGLGALSIIIGLLQLVGGPESVFYYYRVTTEGSIEGLFANRNHYSMYLACLIPMLAIYASSSAISVERAQFRMASSLASGLVILVFLFVIGSRSGLVLGFFSIILSALVYRAPAINAKPKRGKRDRRPVVAIGTGLGLVLLIAMIATKSDSLHRLLSTDRTEIRLLYWGPVLHEILNYFPVGSGYGSFVEVFQYHEPTNLIEPSYANHAHNDALEALLTGGIVGGALLVAGIGAWLVSVVRSIAHRLTGRAALYYRLGAIVLFLLAVGSIADYPLRVPALASLAAMCAVWMQEEAHAKSDRAPGPAEAA